MRFFNNIRTPDRRVSFQQAIIHTLLITCTGLILGLGVKFLDIYTTNLGNVFFANVDLDFSLYIDFSIQQHSQKSCYKRISILCWYAIDILCNSGIDFKCLFNRFCIWLDCFFIILSHIGNHCLVCKR